MRKLLRSPLLGGVGAILSIAWEAFWLLGAPIGITPDGIRNQYLLWGLVCLTICGIQAFTFLVKNNRELTERIEPKLSLVFKPEQGAPYVHNKLPNEGGWGVRVFRVGVLNAGKKTVTNVAVKLVGMNPAEELGTYLAHELQVAGQSEISRSDVNYSSEPLVFFDVIAQMVKEGQPATDLHMRYAAKWLFGRPLGGADQYVLTLAIDGEAAEPPVRFLVFRGSDGNYWMQRH